MQVVDDRPGLKLAVFVSEYPFRSCMHCFDQTCPQARIRRARKTQRGMSIG